MISANEVLFFIQRIQHFEIFYQLQLISENQDNQTQKHAIKLSSAIDVKLQYLNIQFQVVKDMFTLVTKKIETRYLFSIRFIDYTSLAGYVQIYICMCGLTSLLAFVYGQQLFFENFFIHFLSPTRSKSKLLLRVFLLLLFLNQR